MIGEGLVRGTLIGNEGPSSLRGSLVAMINMRAVIQVLRILKICVECSLLN